MVAQRFRACEPLKQKTYAIGRTAVAFLNHPSYFAERHRTVEFGGPPRQLVPRDPKVLQHMRVEPQKGATGTPEAVRCPLSQRLIRALTKPQDL